MILIDDRTGSRELAPLFKQLGQPFKIIRLEYADFAFDGNGPDGEVVKVGIERKTVPDLLQSLASGRFADGQLPGLQATYNHFYIFIEGAMRRSLKEEGMLEYSMDGMPWTTGYSKPISWYAVFNALATFEDCGARLRFPYQQRDTATQVASLYQRSQKAVHHAHQVVKKVLVARRAGPVAKVARALGLGHKYARAAEERWGTDVSAMITASHSEWCEIVSKPTATKVINVIQGAREK